MRFWFNSGTAQNMYTLCGAHGKLEYGLTRTARLNMNLKEDMKTEPEQNASLLSPCLAI